MNRRHVLALLGALPLIISRPGFAEPDETRPQPELPKEKLVIVGADGKAHDFTVEMAVTEDQQMVGLMLRPSVAPDGGMLFDWTVPHESDMWMKNTLVPLDMVFIDSDGRIRAIAENTVPESLAVISSHGPVRATLELAGGTTRRLNIKPGDLVRQRVFNNVAPAQGSARVKAAAPPVPMPAPAHK